MADDPIQRLEYKLDAHFTSLQEYREDVVQRLTRIETTIVGETGIVPTLEKHGERIASLETHRTYAKGILTTLTFLWGGVLAYLRYWR
jgi:hypothetical protein